MIEHVVVISGLLEFDIVSEPTGFLSFGEHHCFEYLGEHVCLFLLRSTIGFVARPLFSGLLHVLLYHLLSVGLYIFIRGYAVLGIIKDLECSFVGSQKKRIVRAFGGSVLL